MLNRAFITSALELPGYRMARNFGIVRGIVVRSRSIVGTIGAGIQSLFGGNITLWTEMCEHARQEAFDLMALHAEQMGANAIIAFRYDATEVSAGVTEVLAYGTAILVEPER
ncbi:MAG TPA: YbjQ family protein [Thermoanaerobaculia bacterium]|nr:YbjQ family protein [Thermoanaerobaculia bacterium]